MGNMQGVGKVAASKSQEKVRCDPHILPIEPKHTLHFTQSLLVSKLKSASISENSNLSIQQLRYCLAPADIVVQIRNSSKLASINNQLPTTSSSAFIVDHTVLPINISSLPSQLTFGKHDVASTASLTFNEHTLAIIHNDQIMLNCSM
jgi:hypothetical protein